MEVHLTVLNFCWERSYHFDDLSHLNIGVLKNIVLNEPDFAGYRYLYAFYQGLLVPYDDVSLENMVRNPNYYHRTDTKVLTCIVCHIL